MKSAYILNFSEIGMKDVARVGRKRRVTGGYSSR
jgi:hypothetical protein